MIKSSKVPALKTLMGTNLNDLSSQNQIQQFELESLLTCKHHKNNSNKLRPGIYNVKGSTIEYLLVKIIKVKAKRLFPPISNCKSLSFACEVQLDILFWCLEASLFFTVPSACRCRTSGDCLSNCNPLAARESSDVWGYNALLLYSAAMKIQDFGWNINITSTETKLNMRLHNI